jgi:hypothetical protein
VSIPFKSALRAAIATQEIPLKTPMDTLVLPANRVISIASIVATAPGRLRAPTRKWHPVESLHMAAWYRYFYLVNPLVACPLEDSVVEFVPLLPSL